jgi:hypothetical protein
MATEILVLLNELHSDADAHTPDSSLTVDVEQGEDVK